MLVIGSSTCFICRFFVRFLLELNKNQARRWRQWFFCWHLIARCRHYLCNPSSWKCLGSCCHSLRGTGWLVIWNLPDFKTKKKRNTWKPGKKKHTSDSHFLEDLNHLFSTRSCPTWPISNIPRGIFLQSLKNQKGPLGPGPLGPLGTIYWDSHGK